LRQESNQGDTDVANKIYECLEDELVTKRSTVREMKKTHVFLFDEAQELLETHYGFQAFLFRCIRTWLRKKRGRKKQGRTTVIAVFSGTSSAILSYTVKTDLLKDDDLKPVSPSRDSQSNQNDLYYTTTTTLGKITNRFVWIARIMSTSQQQQHRDSKRSNRHSKKRTIDELRMEGDDPDDVKKATAAVGAEESLWEKFKKKYQFMEDHVDSIKEVYRELSKKLKMKGKTMTSQKLNDRLVSEFCEDGNDEVGNKFRQNEQIAKDALKILEGEGLPVMPTAGVEKSSWEIFQKTYPSMKGQVDSIKKIYRELNDKLKMKGTKMTSQKLNDCLVSEFLNDGKNELVNVFRRDPQIAQYALEILR
jgi:uncharacterized protein YukE